MDLLVVGGGSIGERHARCFLQTGRCRVSLCEVNAALRERLAGQYPLAESFSSIEAALERPWDAVLIATPAHLHVSMALAAAERGCHLFIEKPLSTTLRQVEALQNVARERNLVVTVGYVYRAHPAVGEMKSYLLSGDLGPIHLVTVVAGQNFPRYRPAYREIYYADRATGGGAVQDALTHLANLVQHFVGRYDWVFADYAHQALEGVEVEDTVNLVGRLNDESILASITLNQFMAANELRFDVHGGRGSARFAFHEHCWGTIRQGEDEWEMRPPQAMERDESFVRQANAFLDAVEKHAPVLCSLEEAAHTLRVNLAALRSGATRQPVAINSVDETFRPD